MIEQLFGSKTRVKLLRLFYSNPNRSFYVREITRKIDEQINSVRRELSNLLSIGIIASDNNENKLYYEVDQTFEYYTPLSQMFGGSKASGTKSKASVSSGKTAKTPSGKAHSESDIVRSLGNVDLAIYTGQFTRDESTGVDVLIVGNVNNVKVNNFISELESRENKDIRYTVLSERDFNYRRQINDRFISSVFSCKKQVLVDKHGVL